MSNNQFNEENTAYFKQYGHGLGYVNEIREIPKSGTPPRYSARIAALQGSPGNIHNEYHDLVIDSVTAYALLFHYRDEIEDDRKKVIVKFHFHNPRAKGFTIKQGKSKGKIGVVTNGYLTRISYISIDGEVVYREDRKNDNPSSSNNAYSSENDVANEDPTGSNVENNQARGGESNKARRIA